MHHINIKPLSVNQSYKGRHFPTAKLLKYKNELHWELPRNIGIPKEGKLKVKYIFGVSSKKSDGDNLIKSFQDCLSEVYGFNDNQIYKWEVEKVDVKKGAEFIDFEIEIC